MDDVDALYDVEALCDAKALYDVEALYDAKALHDVKLLHAVDALYEARKPCMTEQQYSIGRSAFGRCFRLKSRYC